MVSSKFVGMFNLWQRELERLGYANFAHVLNAKDYGVPQNRERIFLVSIRIDGLDGLNGQVRYNFPKPFPLVRRLKDVLEEHVDEKYYLSDKMLEGFIRTSEDDSHNHNFKPTAGGGECLHHKNRPRSESGRQLCVQQSGRVNSSQDGVIVDSAFIAPCHSAGHGNCPKIREDEFENTSSDSQAQTTTAPTEDTTSSPIDTPKSITAYYDDYLTDISGVSASAAGAVVKSGDALELIEVGGVKYFHAKQLGISQVTDGNTTVEITVLKAKINIIVIMGQSNSGNHFDNATSDIKCPLGTAYWWGNGQGAGAKAALCPRQ